MMWSQEIVRGQLAVVGEGIWSGDTFKASVIEIGNRRLEDIRAALIFVRKAYAIYMF